MEKPFAERHGATAVAVIDPVNDPTTLHLTLSRGLILLDFMAPIRVPMRLTGGQILTLRPALIEPVRYDSSGSRTQQPRGDREPPFGAVGGTWR